MMNKMKKLLFFTMMASISITSLSEIQVFGQSKSQEMVVIQDSITPRYSYITSANLDFSISSSGAKYSIYIRGKEITKISGTLTLYKDGEYVTSKRISENSNMLNTSGTLTASGRGSYELIFSGTVSTKNGSEPITISESDSYWAEIIELQ